MENKDNSKVIRTFTNGSLAVLGLFAVLSYGLAALALLFGKGIGRDVVVLVEILVFLPTAVFGIFICLVMWYGKKSPTPQDAMAGAIGHGPPIYRTPSAGVLEDKSSSGTVDAGKKNGGNKTE